MAQQKKLSPMESRTDLTDRELVKIIGGLLGSLALMTDLETLRSAVRWWADGDENWHFLWHMRQTEQQMEAIRKLRPGFPL